MATRSNICVKIRKEDLNKVMHFDVSKLPNGKAYDSSYKSSIQDVKLDKDYIQIYHHWDGYPEGLGKTLVEEFNDYETILNLLLGGDASSINEQVIVQYCSWRNEDWDSVKPTLCDKPSLDEKYLYKFEDGKWWVKAEYDSDLKEWADLKEYLEEVVS